eukprot:CAMPEP_0169309064 /NCGR_PEP_ID=MMETSP1017-20121227/2206_1 /TAXON_ID=342587 /ORGANISM="Karlodinium micrum, Strain CCMP2283" /LENGTH=93 /DNA_ID=CAMNT_0009402553 /DNA_START=1310 /DNA_END=1591 /DNA_ORIENTATION=-
MALAEGSVISRQGEVDVLVAQVWHAMEIPSAQCDQPRCRFLLRLVLSNTPDCSWPHATQLIAVPDRVCDCHVTQQQLATEIALRAQRALNHLH